MMMYDFASTYIILCSDSIIRVVIIIQCVEIIDQQLDLAQQESDNDR
jgi:hypothetical protein